ncbi:signal peptidase I [Helicobacter cetorum]|uniref:signal peptidase I n=1 Tax=Helicobacter cetorum TaxID=138563 RepID=UPI000CF1C700|nr:signal peptidase I [Helicobacter cetorum]
MKFLRSFYQFCSSWVGTIVIVLLVVFFIAQAFIIPSRSMVGTLYEGDMLFVKKFAYGIPIPKIPWIELPIMPDFKNNGHLIEGKHPKRGEIVVFIPPHEKKSYYVKRNFAIGGDEVLFTQEGLYLHPFESDNDTNYIAKHFPNAKTKEFMGKTFVLNPYAIEHLGIHYQKNNETFEVMAQLANQGGGANLSMQLIQIEGESVFYKKINPNEFFMIGDNRDNSSDSRFWGSIPYKNVVGSPWLIYFSLNLKNSLEVDAENNPKKRYLVRWERMFKTIDGIEKALKEKQQKPSITPLH